MGQFVIPYGRQSGPVVERPATSIRVMYSTVLSSPVDCRDLTVDGSLRRTTENVFSARLRYNLRAAL